MTTEDIHRFLPKAITGRKLPCVKVYFPALDTLTEEEEKAGPDIMTVFDDSGQVLVEYRCGTIICNWYDNGLKYQTKEISDTAEILRTYEYSPEGDLYHIRETVLSTSDPVQEGKAIDIWTNWEKYDRRQICYNEFIERYGQTENQAITIEWYDDVGKLLSIEEWRDYLEQPPSPNSRHSNDKSLLEEYHRLETEFSDFRVFEKHLFYRDGHLWKSYSEQLVHPLNEKDYLEQITTFYNENGLRERVVNHSTGMTERLKYTYNANGDWVFCRISNNRGDIVRILRVFEN